MNFNSDNAGRYKSFHIGPGTEVDGNCISIGKNVYNNIDKSIRIGYEPDSGTTGTTSNHLLITPTYTETLKPLSTTGVQAIRVNGELESATDLHYDSANHFFRDFDVSIDIPRKCRNSRIGLEVLVKSTWLSVEFKLLAAVQPDISKQD